jgi:hypothetical protein
VKTGRRLQRGSQKTCHAQTNNPLSGIKAR